MASEIVFVFGFSSILMAISYVVFSPFLLTVYRAMNRVRPSLRQISPGAVWFAAFPLFGFIFAIWMVQAVAASLRKQFEELGEAQHKATYGQFAGFIWALSFVVFFFVSLIDFAPKISEIANLIWTVSLMISVSSWIVYWAQVSEYSQRLSSHKLSEPSPEELDYDDDLDVDRDHYSDSF